MFNPFRTFHLFETVERSAMVEQLNFPLDHSLIGQGALMSHLRSLGLGVLLSGMMMLFSSVLEAADGVIYRNPDSSGTFCHLRFPAIREETLSSNRPQLKDPSEGDIIDFYGPCDYDPLGKAEVLRQRSDARRERDRYDGETD